MLHGFLQLIKITLESASWTNHTRKHGRNPCRARNNDLWVKMQTFQPRRNRPHRSKIENSYKYILYILLILNPKD